MRTYEQCLTCFERQADDVCTMAKLDAPATATMLATVRERIATFPMEYPPIKMAVDIHDLIRAESGIRDPYAALKQMANDVCRELGPLLTQTMNTTQKPLQTAVKLAIAGNIIDCGAYGLRDVTHDKLVDVIQDVLAQPLQGHTIEMVDQLIKNARNILYIGDNAGECFFDIPLLDLIPRGKVTYAVRGGPVLNDATQADAEAASIHDRCRVIDTGDNAPGVLLDRCCEPFRGVFDQSDLIISKGQGNYESMSGITDKPILFLTKVKCEMIGQDIGYPYGSNVVKIINQP